MAYSVNYSQLVTQLSNVVEDESDEYLADRDNIIARAELRVLRDIDLELFKGVNTAVSTVQGTREVSIPGTLVSVDTVSMTASGSYVPLFQRSYDYCTFYAPTVATQAQPKYYAFLTATQLYIVPTPNAVYPLTMRGLQRPASMSSGNPTTWIGDHAGDLLYYAAVIESETFLADKARADEVRVSYAERLPQSKMELREETRADYSPVRRAAST
jgi:hypothetical protein